MSGGTFPRFRLYDSTGVTLIYELERVIDWGNSPFLNPKSYTEHVSHRGQGSIVSDGSLRAWDLPLTFILLDSDYEALVAQLNTLSTTIAHNTKYILKVDLTSGGSTKDLKVKRLEDIPFPITSTSNKVTKFQTGTLTLRVNSWA